MQSPSWLKYVFFHSGTKSKVLGCSMQRDTGYLCESVGKGVDLMLCYRGSPQQLRKGREDMFCIIRVGLDLCLMGDCTGFFSGSSNLCPIGHASSAVLMSFKWELTTSSAWGCQCQPGGIMGLLPSWAQCQAGCWWAWLRGAHAASASSPLLEGQVKGKKKKRGVGSKRNWMIFAFHVDGSFQMTPTSCEIVLSLTWQWPAYVQLVQVKVWGHIRGNCFTAVHLWCKK